VNNAGYGLAGCFEEYEEEHVRRQFDVNFFGLVSVPTWKVLHMEMGLLTVSIID
jgi:short-subunit dehydrogenase